MFSSIICFITIPTSKFDALVEGKYRQRRTILKAPLRIFPKGFLYEWVLMKKSEVYNPGVFFLFHI